MKVRKRKRTLSYPWVQLDQFSMVLWWRNSQRALDRELLYLEVDRKALTEDVKRLSKAYMDLSREEPTSCLTPFAKRNMQRAQQRLMTINIRIRWFSSKKM